MKESDVKYAVEQYLDYMMNQGKLWWTRLNAGMFIMGEGKTKRVIRGTKKGTADLLAISRDGVNFIECKSDKGKQSPEQIEFQKQVEALGCKYILVRDVEEVIEYLT